MNLHEYQTKQLLAQQGISVPKGEVASSPDQVRAIAQTFDQAIAVKAQVLTGGRGKAGGIAVVNTPPDAAHAAARILGMDIKGHRVQHVLVEQAAQIAQEIYLAALVDRQTQRIMLMASAEGGMDIEEVAAAHPEKIRRVYADPLVGLHQYQGLTLAKAIGLASNHWFAFSLVAQRLFTALVTHDADLAEINPLVVDDQGQLLALDGKMSIDDNALGRHPEWQDEDLSASRHPLEVRGQEAGLNFVYLGGNVACLGNGAGLAMATMDAVKLFGGEPANFLDIGGGASITQVTQALEIMVSDPAVRSVLVNISGGITRCDEVATGIAAAITQTQTPIPFIVRLVGTNEEEAHAILQPYDVEFAQTFTDVAKRAVAVARESL